MSIDTHSVVYFINEEYGVVIRANGATGEVAMWEAKSGTGGSEDDADELAGGGWDARGARGQNAGDARGIA